MEFTGKRILISGAGKGIGRATVTFLVARGVAAAVAYLLSDAAAMVNGISMPVDSGFLLDRQASGSA